MSIFCFSTVPSYNGLKIRKNYCQNKINFTTKNLINTILTPSNKKKKNFFMKTEKNDDSIVWEVDFFSRPVVDDNGKKLWELIVVDQKNNFEHVETVPNNLVNSKELKKRLSYLLDKSEKKPKTIKFFRSQMYNMINIALSELDLTVKPSRRTFSLYQKIKERENSVYPNMSGYRPFMRETDASENYGKVPQKMPDALRGEKYIFASLQASELESLSKSGVNFSDFCPIPEDLDKKAPIPGIVILSERAKSLSSWLDGIELCDVVCDLENKNLILECGLDIQYLFARFSEKNEVGNINIEAKFFEKNKKKSKGIHFVAVQQLTGQKEISGIWTLKS